MNQTTPRHVRWAAASALAMSLLLSACGGGGGGGSDDNATAPPATVAGTVFDATTGAPVVGATVQSGSFTTTTGADGKFTLGMDVNTRAVLKINKTAYAENVVVAAAVDQQTTTVTAQLLPVTATTAIDAAVGGTVTVDDSPAQVTLPAASLVRSDGLPLSGAVTVSVTPIDPGVNPAYMPGDFRARTTAGLATIESFGAMTVTLADATGAPVNLAAGKTATIRIPVGTRGTPPASIPLFWFNTATGEWVEEGTATLAGTAPNQYYEGTVAHFTTWNADQYADTINVTGCLKDEAGTAIVGARVVSDGIDYSGTSSGTTDANGQFSVPMKLSGIATLTAQSGIRFSNTLSVGPETADFAALPAGECLVLSTAASGLTIKLTWGRAPEDLDSHLLLPDGTHIYYGASGSLTAAPFANLDVDDTDSYGPEVVTVRRLMVGTYRYAVHNYSGTFNPGQTASPARVELNTGGNTSVYAPPAGETASTDTWNVFSFTVDAQCRITVTPVNTWTVPAESATSTPVYCTAP